MKILAGIYSQDSGEIWFQGQPLERLTPKLVERLGIHFIHQERYIVPYLTVAESLFLGIEPSVTPIKWIKRRSLEKEAEAHLKEKVGIDCWPSADRRTDGRRAAVDSGLPCPASSTENYCV
ncbi:hypothetical protein EXW96_01075 [Paenibacillus sp. JMULE4]|uniref:hypothetical protein n=1 Tax=Paenibacillus sp. JMULE4 TaxID=2518342 RepID=UPI001575DB42|nr:hypothetical protein [Paenibacillus sp. JMULE4]NTZ16231.1 hypothetical protein [Paenibacillus sp. JMULE4]